MIAGMTPRIDEIGGSIDDMTPRIDRMGPRIGDHPTP
jgi:hypothetical protein